MMESGIGYNQIQSRIQEQNQAQMKKSKKSEEKK